MAASPMLRAQTLTSKMPNPIRFPAAEPEIRQRVNACREYSAASDVMSQAAQSEPPQAAQGVTTQAAQSAKVD